MRRLLDADPVTKTRSTFYVEGGDIIVHDEADVTGIVEANKANLAETDERARWGDGHGDLVASIPAGIYYREVVATGMSERDFRRWLDHPDRRAFRTRPGRLSK